MVTYISELFLPVDAYAIQIYVAHDKSAALPLPNHPSPLYEYCQLWNLVIEVIKIYGDSLQTVKISQIMVNRIYSI